MLMNQLSQLRPLSGYQLVINDAYEHVQCKFPRSKKKRIRKKWAKRTPRNLRLHFKAAPLIPNEQVIKVEPERLLICNSWTYHRIVAYVNHAQSPHEPFQMDFVGKYTAIED